MGEKRIEPEQKIIGERVAYLRSRSGITQDKVAEVLGVTRGSIVRLESGRRPLEDDEAAKLSSFFGVDVLNFEETEEFRTFQVQKTLGTMARRFKQARKMANFTQAQAAKAIGMEQSMISKTESGLRRLGAEELAFFSELFNVDPQWLAGMELTYSHV